MSDPKFDGLSCPVPITTFDTVQLAHGAGGSLSSELIDKMIVPRFSNSILDKLEDHAVLNLPAGRLAFSTDTFVVSPLFFPGGDIGDLAINGTVNDVAMSGAKPLYLSVGLVLEEGLPLETLHRVLLSMENAAKKAGVAIVTGDTKVVNRGACDQMFINTSGVGVIPEGVNTSASSLAAGDAIIISGTLADHGMAVMTTREGMSFESRVQSDSAPLNELVSAILEICPEVKALRDPTRGGLATTLNEFAASSKVGIQLQESEVPVRPDTFAACELLGIDPLYVANEGKLCAIVPQEKADAVVKAIRAVEFGENAKIIGHVTDSRPGTVTMLTELGSERIVDMPVGQQLPRIC